ncbi:MAG: efflux RND transporter periplasmic adaptor subunit [bacterium]|nr:efflux RND transporter periplasmic adaptor subunit [bacterium]
MKVRKKTILFGALLVLLWGVHPGYTENHEPGEHPEKTGHEPHEDNVVRLSGAQIQEFGIELAVAGSGTLSVHVSLPGEIVVNPDRFAHIVPRVSGVVRRVHKKLGDRVQAGEGMAVLESRELSDLKSAYLAARERLALSEATFQREEKLWKDSISSEREYLEAKQALAEGRIVLRSAEHKLYALGFSEKHLSELPAQPDVSFTRYEITAPFVGRVIEKHITLGEAVKDDAEIFSVADLSTVWVNLTVYQKDLPSIRMGQQVEVSAREGIQKASGRIAYISPIIDEESRTATARLVLPNSKGHWRPGLFIIGKIAVESLFVPILVLKTAIQTVAEKPVVFVQEEEGFEPQLVKTGRGNETHIEILSGLRPGQTYAAKGAFTLKAQLSKGDFGEGHSH